MAKKGMSERQYATHAGMSRGAIQKAKQSGRLVMHRDGSIDAAASDRRLVAVTDPSQQRGASAGSTGDAAEGASFIKARIFNESFRVVKIDGSLLEYTQLLSSLYNQYRSVGVNYNQTVSTLKSKFEERKALAMLYKLEQQTAELVLVSRQILALSQEFRRLWLQKSASADHSQGR